jgi:hypothetical protein
VPAVGDLNGGGCTTAGGLGVGTCPVPADDGNEGHEGAGIGSVRHEAMGHDDLMRGIDGDLPVVALHEPVARGQDAAVRVCEVALRPIWRTAVLTT